MGYNDSVRLAIRATRNYWKGCTFSRLKDEAMVDHRRALNEIIGKGYTWGLKHPLPFQWQGMEKSDVISIRNSLFPRKNYNKNRYEERHKERMKN
tara:strand:+ start:189 stop:473 length:285 start_codon:yes stop_codon:yes gene_type:complete